MTEDQQNGKEQATDKSQQIAVSSMYKDYFLDYASYVIMEWLVPACSTT